MKPDACGILANVWVSSWKAARPRWEKISCAQSENQSLLTGHLRGESLLHPMRVLGLEVSMCQQPCTVLKHLAA